jgi:hypothetical protein
MWVRNPLVPERAQHAEVGDAVLGLDDRRAWCSGGYPHQSHPVTRSHSSPVSSARDVARTAALNTSAASRHW